VRRGTAARASLGERGSRPVRRRAGALGGAAAAPAPDRRTARDAAHRPAARAAPRGPHAVATAWHTARRAALAGHRVRLERAVARAGAAAPRHGSGPPSRRRERAARRPARPVGPRSPGWILRRRPAAHGRRRTFWWEAADTTAVVAVRAGARTTSHARVRRPDLWCDAGPCMGRRRRARRRRPVVRVADAGAVHGRHGHDPGGRRTTAARCRRMNDLAALARREPLT